MFDWLFVVRLVHIAAGIAWIGEVATVIFVLVPALRRADAAGAQVLLDVVFPRAFKLATVLGGTAIAAGLILVTLGPGGLQRAFSTTWGTRILAGGILGAALYVFHLVLEPRLEGRLLARISDPGEVGSHAAADLRILRVVPPVGLLILLTVVALMSAGARLS
ncbi:MAG: hypothetical protein ACRDGQ_03795 [Candidatus Limnocylindrales bacterium]